jgi:hypothetical protein
MHPVFIQRLGAQHIKAMTEVADKASLARQARRARLRKSVGRTNRRAPDAAGQQPCPHPDDELVKVDGLSVTRGENAFGMRPGPAVRAEEG